MTLPPNEAPTATVEEVVEPVVWVEESYGARVATILENEESIVEIQDLRNGKYSLTVHWTNQETRRRDDLSATMKAADLAKIGALFPSAALEAAEAERDALRTRVEEMEKALEPFADACDQVDRSGHPDTAGFIGAGLTLGDLRRARALKGDAGGTNQKPFNAEEIAAAREIWETAESAKGDG